MAGHFADRLTDAIQQKRAPVCVGIDPTYQRLPDELKTDGATVQHEIEAIERFCHDLVQIVAPIVPAVKLQSAYFESYGAVGVDLYFRVIWQARQQGLLVIGDVKRNDIGSTAAAYAVGHLKHPDAPDAITVNGYLGADGLAPFIDAAGENAQGIFVLVRTSNPSAATLQDVTDADGKKLYEHAATMVAALGGPETVGQSGQSFVGAVVGATWPEEAKKLREMMPNQIFLVPGYGAQGATANDCAASFRADGTGAIVNASRSVMYAFSDPGSAGLPWQEAVEQAARDFAADVAQAVGM